MCRHGRAQPQSNMRTDFEHFLKTLCHVFTCAALVKKKLSLRFTATIPENKQGRRGKRTDRVKSDFHKKKRMCRKMFVLCLRFGSKFVVRGELRGQATESTTGKRERKTPRTQKKVRESSTGRKRSPTVFRAATGCNEWAFGTTV